jgi:hypothetical protein
VNAAVELLDACEMRVGDGARRRRPGAIRVGQLVRGQVREVQG